MSTMVAPITTTRTIVPVTCGVCHVLFGMELDHNEKVRRDGSWFHCPNGCKIHYYESEEQRLQQQLARATHRADQAEARVTDLRRQAVTKDRQIRARKAVATRLRRKISAGRCPCCSHEFKDLHKHMRTEHPKWNPERAADAIAAKGTA